jgi:hypothetical protein
VSFFTGVLGAKPTGAAAPACTQGDNNRRTRQPEHNSN